MSAQPQDPLNADLHPVNSYDGGPDMTLIDHLKELRTRVLWSAIAVILGIVVCAVFWEVILGWLLAPARAEIEGFKVSSFSPVDRIGVIFKIVMYGGLILASPMVLYQVMAFVIPGLTPRERKMLAPGILGAIVFLLAGMAFSYYIILPASLGFLLGVGDKNFENVIGAKQYLDFVTRLIFWVGIAFEMPVVLALLARFGVVRAGQLLGFWRYAIVIIAIAAAIITPTPDPLNMALVMGPLFALYFLGIFFALMVQKPRPKVEPV